MIEHNLERNDKLRNSNRAGNLAKNSQEKRFSDEAFKAMLDRSLHRTLFDAVWRFLIVGAIFSLPWIALNVFFVFGLKTPDGRTTISTVSSEPNDFLQTVVLESGLWLFWWVAIGRSLKCYLQCMWQLIDPKTSWLRRNLLVDSPQVAQIFPIKHDTPPYGILPLPPAYSVHIQFSNGWQYRLITGDNEMARQLSDAIRERSDLIPSVGKRPL